ncbi:MAG TPA: hypothetical protein VM287_09910 [Egibacteraceae bacterium]|nr:hypothetical protein [Egibacteraceae bacterium]
MAQSTLVSRRSSVFVFLLAATALGFAALAQSPADATHETVTEVEGSAFGCYANTTFSFDPANPGPASQTGPLPEVTLPPQGGSDTATAPECRHFAFPGGPPVVSTGPLTVTTEGTTGPTGSVTSTATIDRVNTSGNENFTAVSVSSTCTADETGASGTTTITGGVVHNAVRPDGTTGDVVVPLNPDPGYTVTVDIGFARYNYIFNEQIRNDDGSITVNAVRMEPLTGPLQGTMILGQVVCGVTTQPLPPTTTTTEAPTTTVAPTTTTTVAPTTTTTVPPGGAAPQSREDCKDGGWEDYGFRNQGQCMRYVNTGQDSRAADDGGNVAAASVAASGDSSSGGSIFGRIVSALRRLF